MAWDQLFYSSSSLVQLLARMVINPWFRSSISYVIHSGSYSLDCAWPSGKSVSSGVAVCLCMRDPYDQD